MTHEPHFCLLREVVSFTGGGRGQPAREVLDNPCQEHFVLLQIGCEEGWGAGVCCCCCPLHVACGACSLRDAAFPSRAVPPAAQHCVLNSILPPHSPPLRDHSPARCLLRDYFDAEHCGSSHQPPRNPTLCSLLRDYIDAEFRSALEGRLPFAYDLERVVDDFVLFCMLVSVTSLAGDGSCTSVYLTQSGWTAMCSAACWGAGGCCCFGRRGSAGCLV